MFILVILLFSFSKTHGLAVIQSLPEMNVSPSNIVEGLTEQMHIACSLRMKEKSSMALLFSMSISHAMINDESNFTDISSLSSFGVFTALVGDDTHVSGVINNTELSYIKITIENPHINDSGLYRCEVNGVSKVGKPVTILSTQEVTINSPTLSLAIQEMNTLRQSLELIVSENKQMKEALDRFELETEILKSKLLNESDNISYLKKTDANIIDNIKSISNIATRINNSLNSSFYISKTAFLVSSNIFNGRRYWLTRSVTFFNSTFAEDVCELYGGYLAEIDTKAEFDFVKSFVSTNGNWFHVITGGTDEEREGVWVNRHSKSTVASFWANNEPNNSEGYENCQAFSRQENWNMNDVFCNFVNTNGIGFVCEIPE